MLGYDYYDSRRDRDRDRDRRDRDRDRDRDHDRHCDCDRRDDRHRDRLVCCCDDGRRFNALDRFSNHPFSKRDDGEIFQEADQVSDISQRSHERIVIKDSCDIEVSTTETQVAVSLQAALQVAIALVVNLTIADDNQAEKVTQELLQLSRIQQSNRQSIFIENSRDIEVKTTDTDVAISIQLLLQLLLALLIQIDIF